MNRNKTFQTSKKVLIKEDFSLKSILFPELINTINTESETKSETQTQTINYKNILLNPVSEDFKPFIHIKKITENELELKKKLDFKNETINIITKMSERWLQKRLDYIELYGEDEYERWYIPLHEWEEKNNSESESESEYDIESSDEENYDN